MLFQAPEGFPWLGAIRCFICNDNWTDPDHPEMTTTDPFIATVWAPVQIDDDIFPAHPPVVEFHSGAHYWEDSWVRFDLPQAIDLRDPTIFPERTFFVGMQWLSIYNPVLGYDAEVIPGGRTCNTFSMDWQCGTESAAMIRAVVSDEDGTSVEIDSWGRIKAVYE
ncbi:MAG: hypothetical protein GF405_03140 [Candidatus Eisenbacteria bacterium]|nr:hypothetical protein [Candidatus Eisenbacteria bacterium]